jgi:hypothetical protein
MTSYTHTRDIISKDTWSVCLFWPLHVEYPVSKISNLYLELLIKQKGTALIICTVFCALQQLGHEFLGKMNMVRRCFKLMKINSALMLLLFWYFHLLGFVVLLL